MQYAGLLATTRGVGILLCPTAVTGATWELLTTDAIGAVLNTTMLVLATRALKRAA